MNTKLWLGIGLVMTTCPAPGFAAPTTAPRSAKVDSVLTKALAETPTCCFDVIVRWREGAEDAVVARVAARSKVVVDKMPIVRAVTARVDTVGLRELANDPDVASISSDGAVKTGPLAMSSAMLRP